MSPTAAALDPDVIAERVQDGIDFLGKKNLDKINKRTLDMSNFDTCIAGQLAKHDVNLFELHDCDAAKGVELGFDLAHDDATPENYAALTSAWKKAL